MSVAEDSSRLGSEVRRPPGDRENRVGVVSATGYSREWNHRGLPMAWKVNGAPLTAAVGSCFSQWSNQRNCKALRCSPSKSETWYQGPISSRIRSDAG